MGDSLFVVNPTAGNGQAYEVWKRLQKRLEISGESYRVIISRKPWQIPGLVRDQLELGVPERIIAVGGDGTLSEAVNGFMPRDILFGVIPAGSGNDFARLHQLPFEPEQALEIALNGFAKHVDIATVNDRYLINVGGVGFDAVVASETNRIGKRLGSTLPYVVSLLKTLFTYRNAGVRLEFDDGETIEDQVLLIAVGNGQYYGGGMHILPPADTGDGFLDVLIGGDLGKAETLRLLPQIFKGTHVHHPKVKLRRTRRVKIDADRPLHFHADGEPIGHTPVIFEVLPGKLQLLVGDDQRHD